MNAVGCGSLRQSPHPVGAGAGHRQVVRYEVLRFPQAGRFDQSAIIRWVVRHHDARAGIETVHEHSALVVRGGIHRPADNLGPLLNQPVARRAQHTGGHFRIVDHLQKAEETRLFAVKTAEIRVQNGGDTPYDPVLTPGKEPLHGPVQVERMFRGIE